MLELGIFFLTGGAGRQRAPKVWPLGFAACSAPVQKGADAIISAIAFTAGAETALRLAQESAAELGHSYVGTEHLLLGVAREGRGPGAKALQSAGLSAEALRAALVRLIGLGSAGAYL